MKRYLGLFAIVVACAAIGWVTYLVAAPAPPPLSGYVPAGALVYLEANDFSTASCTSSTMSTVSVFGVAVSSCEAACAVFATPVSPLVVVSTW